MESRQNETRGRVRPDCRTPGLARAHVGLLGLLVGLAVGPGTAAGQSKSPVPDFDRDRHVYTVGVPDQYGRVRDEIARLEARSPQTYYVVVTRTTGPARGASRDYLDELVSTWTRQAKAQKAKFDTRRAVFIVLALEDRKIIVLGGEDLQEQLGFRDPYIERELLQPHFYTYARSGDYARGLQILLGQIDRWITEHDRSLQARQAESAARDARLGTEAQTTIGEAEAALGRVRKDLDDRKTGGLAIERYETSFRRASDDLQTARRRLDQSASESLQLAQEAQRELRGIDDRLAQVASRQAELDTRIRKAHSAASEVLEAIEQAGRAGLPVAAVQARLDSIRPQIDQADRTLKADPDQAEALLSKVESELTDVLEHARSLAELRKQAQLMSSRSQTIEGAAATQLERAKRAGVSTERLASDWRAAQKLLADARASVETDDRAAVAAFGQAEKIMDRVADDARSRSDRHRFQTRTLPITALGVLAVVALAVVGLLWYRKHRLRGRLDRQFKEFRAQAVALMDRLDGLRQHHKTLPATDPDYTRPMSGATAALYASVETDLTDLWDHWLKVMEVWDRAEALGRAGSGLAVAQVEEAKALLEKEGDFEELARRCDSCRERLDQLEQAHEKAREALDGGRRQAVELRSTLQTVTAAGLPIEVFVREIGGVDALLSQAEGLIEADPIGAAEVVAKSREALDATAGRVAEVLSRLDEVRAVREAADEQAARAAKLRAEGSRLSEEEADPDGLLEHARAACDIAMESLRKADPAAAAPRIGQAREAVEAARTRIDDSLQARDRCRNELPARHEASASLARELEQAAPTLDGLRRGFAPSSWADVAGHLDQARSIRQSSDARIAEAEAAAAPSRQAFLHAAVLLDYAAHEQAHAHQLLVALAGKYTSLGELARQGAEAVRGLDDQLERARTFFAENRRAIGDGPRRSLEQAAQARRELGPLASSRTPDWPDVHRRIEAAAQGVAVALRQGQEDVEGCRQVLRRHEAVRQKAERIGQMLDRETRDRPPANQRYRGAAAALSEFERGVDAPGPGWNQRLGRLQEIEADLDSAEALSRQDLTLASGAETAIHDADRSVRQVKAFYEAGVTADTRAAESRIDQARQAFASQSYEQAVDLAEQARQSAQQARESAAQEARRRQQRTESAQVLGGTDAAVLIAAAQAAAQAAAGWAGSRDDRAKPAAEAPASQSAGQGDWTSGASQGSWTSGADEGHW